MCTKNVKVQKELSRRRQVTESTLFHEERERGFERGLGHWVMLVKIICMLAKNKYSTMEEGKGGNNSPCLRPGPLLDASCGTALKAMPGQ
jgi:hypothetical protein